MKTSSLRRVANHAREQQLDPTTIGGAPLPVRRVEWKSRFHLLNVVRSLYGLVALPFGFFVAFSFLQQTATATILMGKWDTDGDGALDSVYNDGSDIQIVSANGRVRTYDIGYNWRLLTASDTDGKRGTELVFNIGWGSILIVHDASRKVKEYYVGPCWAFLVAADTDGRPGMDLVFNVLGSLRIIHDSSGVTSDYPLIAPTWVFMRAAECDAIPGAELLFNLGTTIRIFHEASAGTMTDRFVGGGSWALMDIVDTNGRTGNEMVFNLSGTVKIIRDADGTCSSYAVPVPWTYLGASQLDGLPGLELRFNTGRNVIRVINDRLQALQ